MENSEKSLVKIYRASDVENHQQAIYCNEK
jgi:hypothetical protein